VKFRSVEKQGMTDFESRVLNVSGETAEDCASDTGMKDKAW
jgi:hypothetical protein